MSDGVQSVWVVGRYKGDRAKSIMAHAEQGVGYYDIEDVGMRGKPEIICSFRTIIDDGPLPEHLAVVRDPYKIKKLEAQRLQRSGVQN